MLKALLIKLGAIIGVAASLLWLPAPWSWAGAATVAAAFLGLVGWAVFDVNSSFWARTLWRGTRADKTVALTFDDGPDANFTPQVLAVLREKGVKAAFFCVGERVRQQPELVRQVSEQGHIVGNHSFSHSLWINFGLHRRQRHEVESCNEAIQQAAGVRPHFYRAPFGFKNPALGDVLRKLGMVAIGWQVRGFDAVNGDAARIVTRVVDGVCAGGVITLHDGSGLQGTADRSATLAALPVIIDGLRARGLRIVRLDELLRIEPYTRTGAGNSA